MLQCWVISTQVKMNEIKVNSVFVEFICGFGRMYVTCRNSNKDS